MALRLLLTNLESGLNFYPNHNTPSTAGGFNYGGSTSVFDNKLFRQKSFKFGQGTTFDRPNGGFSNEPFVTSPTIDILSGNPSLETTNPELYQSIMSFAKNNQLKICNNNSEEED